MTGQMTIWDLLPEESLENIPEEEAVRRIGDAIGVSFDYNNFFGDYRVKVGKYTLMIEYARYFTDMDDMNNEEGKGELFIGVGYEDNKHCGASAPVDSIKEAIEWFEKWRER